MSEDEKIAFHRGAVVAFSIAAWLWIIAIVGAGLV